MPGTTNRSQRIENLKKSTEYNRILFDHSPIGLALCTMEGELLDVNPAYARIIGRTVEEVLLLNYWDITPQTYFEAEQQQLRQLKDQGRYGPYEKHYIHKNGQWIPVRLSGQVIRLGDDNFIWSCVEDISDRKHAESALADMEQNFESQLDKRTRVLQQKISKLERTENRLRISEAKYRAILDSAADSIITIDEKGMVNSFNPYAEQMFGYKAREIIGKNVSLLMPEPFQALHDRYLENYLSTRQAKIIGKGREVKGLRKDGSVFDMFLSVSDITINDQRMFTGIISDITGLKRTQSALEESEERFRRSQRFANIGTWDWNIETGELYWSDRIATLFGYKDGELETTYENFLNALHPDDRQYVIDSVNACVEHGAEYNVEHRCVWPNGEVRWMLERGDVIRDSLGSPVRMLGVVQDITERKRTEADLQATKEEAERANQAKSEFLSSMSHELRTPLNAVLGFAQLMEYDDNLNPNQKESIAEIQRAGNHLLELISEVLDLAKIESGHLDLSIEPISLPRLFKECCALIHPFANNKGIKLRCDYYNIDYDEVYVHADNIRLKQILLNLLSNAIKYNHNNGEVTVQCSAPSPVSSPAMIRISVQDTGCGIPEDKLVQLFHPFNRLGAESSGVEGTGIGLVITKRLVHMMSGEIGVESTPGQGSTFWVELPMATGVPSMDRSEVYAADDIDPLKQLSVNGAQKNVLNEVKILVVEDNVTNQVILENQLKVLGYQADVAVNGKQGFELWRKNKYCVILTDVNMPDMDGIEFTKLIRKTELNSGNHIPIIAITANALKGDEELYLAAGMDDYIAKPVDLRTLNQKLDKWLAFALHQSYPTHDYKLNHLCNNIAVDIGVLNNIVGANAAVHKEILSSFSESSHEIVDDIHSAYANHSATDIAWLTHKLKSSSHAIGARDLAQSCEALEHAAKANDWQNISAIYQQLEEVFTSVTKFISRYKHTVSGQVEQGNYTPAQSRFHAQYASVNLLVIDDDKFILRQIAEVAKNLGIPAPQMATSGKLALQLMDKQSTAVNPPAAERPRINLVLCDLNMPGMDGIEFLRHLSQRSYNGGIILVSGEDNRVLKSAEKLAKAHNLNILGTLSKPVTSQKLEPLLTKLNIVSEYKAEEALQLVSKKELQKGISDGQVVVYYQPLIDARSGEIAAMEALARWQHPQKGILGPNTFVPVAEQYQLIDNLTLEVFTQAVSQAKIWQDAGLTLKIAINLSMDCLKRLELPELFISHINRSGLSYSQIAFEVTESRLINDMTTSLEILTRLKLKGIELSIDDFGTGYSTMEQLQRFPFSELKIDRQFVSGAVHDSSNRAILESSIELAKKLDMKVVAEGVETEAELELVTRLGCDYLQGYYFSKPIPEAEVLSWTENWKSTNGFKQLLIRDTGT